MRPPHLASAIAVSTGFTLGDGEWALVAHCETLTPRDLLELALALAREGPEASTERPGQAIIRVPDSLIGAQASAVLHYLGDRTAIYCPESRVTAHAAEAISVLISHAGVLAPAGPGTRQRAVALTPIAHARFRAQFHPAAARITATRAEVRVCSDLIGTGLAAAISELCTKQAALLAPDCHAGALVAW
jgi:hypothetical protein